MTLLEYTSKHVMYSSSSAVKVNVMLNHIIYTQIIGVGFICFFTSLNLFKLSKIGMTDGNRSQLRFYRSFGDLVIT